MKKLLSMILLILVTFLTSCGYSGYSGDRSDLFSVATNSVLYLNGYSWETDFECDPCIEVIEEDDYGRTMFLYYEKYYKGANISFSALIICQDSNEKEVFFYEDVNFIVKEQAVYSQNIEKFTDDEIEYLKSVNDWNEEIDYDKCVRKEISKTKQMLPNEKEIRDLLIEKFALVEGEYSLFMDYMTDNADASKYIMYGYIRKNDKEGIYFIGIVESGDFIKLNTIVPSNVYDYNAELLEFKKANNWY